MWRGGASAAGWPGRHGLPGHRTRRAAVPSPAASLDGPAIAILARTIRADLIRFLIRGGNGAYPVDPCGVRLFGARMTGTGTLEGCRDPRTPGLVPCRFDAAPILRDAAGQVIDLAGSHRPALRR